MKTRNTFVYLLGLMLVLLAAGTASAQSPATTVNINTATADELAKLPGMSKRKVAKVIAGRPYSSAADLSKSGLSSKQIDKLTPLVSFEGGSAPAPAAPAEAEKGAASPAAAATSALRHSSTKTQSATSSTEESTTVAKTPPQPGMVWVTPKSKIYHVEGDRWYGKTKTGQWMTEADAVSAGYRKAK